MSSADRYQSQDRGDESAYRRYLDGMDASMRQKVALTAAHILGEGQIADMGMGSGSGSAALAGLYPELQVIGVDINAEMVERARQRFDFGNLRFVVGDIAEPVFQPESLDGILNSSVLHHVTTFSGYDYQAAARALAEQARALVVGGTLIVRDFVAPPPGEVLLDLPDDDADRYEDGTSSAALFRQFAAEFRPRSERPGFDYREEDGAQPGWRRFRLEHRHAIEFVLRKDYRRDWDIEVLEEYTYFTQGEFDNVFAGLGLRVTASTPIRNPWIVEHRFRHRFELRGLSGQRLPTPPTNFLIAGERVAEGTGVRFTEATPCPRIDYVGLEHFADRETGATFDLAVRPHPTTDVVPFFWSGDQLYVVARRSYPRPILHSANRSGALDGSSPPGYVTEPLNTATRAIPLGRQVEELLASQAGIGPDEIRQLISGPRFFPSPGGIEQLNTSVLVEVTPQKVEREIDNLSGFSTSGLVRAIETRQLLRAAQVGGLPDARLELAVHALVRVLRVARGPWIGHELQLAQLPDVGVPPPSPDPFEPTRRFARSDVAAGFLDVRCARFDELGARGDVVASGVREYVVPRVLGTQTVVIAPLWRCGDQVWLGIERRHLPAPQSYLGTSNLRVAPAWRLPRSVTDLEAAANLARERLAAEHGVECAMPIPLGGPYFPDPGITPEAVFPTAAPVLRCDTRGIALDWLPLAGLAAAAGRSELDGHLAVVALRAAHALDL